MAPKRAAKAAQPPLTNLSIAISGTFPRGQAQIQTLLSQLGATVAKSVTATTNVLVSTQPDVDKSSTKVKAAQKHGIPIVSLDWLDDTEASNTQEDTSNYLLGSGATAQSSQSPPTASAKANGKKRAAPSPTPEPEPDQKLQKTEAKFGEASYAKSNMVIPLDEHCSLPNFQVYIGDDGIVYDASLNQTNASNNNNKFYRIQLLRQPGTDTYKTWTRWGRVGDRGQMAVLGSGSFDEAMSHYEKKFKDKSGLSWKDRAQAPKKGKYSYVERSYAPDSDDEGEPITGNGGDSADASVSVSVVKSELPVPVQSLMELIFNQQYMNAAMSDLNYDAKKMPLGKLSKATIQRGFQCLKDLSALIVDGNAPHDEIEDLSNSYYSLIPHDFRRKRPPVISTSDHVKKELELLESLADMKEAAELMKKDLKNADQMHVLDRQFRGLGLTEMNVIDSNTQEYAELAAYLHNTRGSTHGVTYDIQNIFRIERNGESDRFEKSKYGKVKTVNRRLLWHGSRATNFGGILSQGLRIAPPEAPVSGYMFGKGIYLADMSSKSANYCCSYISDDHALLLLCEAELGDPLYELTGASYSAGEDAIANGSWSTWGKGSTGPSVWKDAECIHPSLTGVQMVRKSHAYLTFLYLFVLVANLITRSPTLSIIHQPLRMFRMLISTTTSSSLTMCLRFASATSSA